MRRLNPKTNKIFKRGDVGENGLVFWQYIQKSVDEKGFYKASWTTFEILKDRTTKQNKAKKEHQKTKEGHIVHTLGRIRFRARKSNIPFNIDADYLLSIATDNCPIFGTNFDWGLDNKGGGRNRPSLDRIIPELGYVKGNLVFISKWANTIKLDATEVELYAIADWLHDKRKEVLSAFQNTTTPVSAGHYSKSKEHTKHGTIPSTGAWEDNYDAHHHRGAVYGEDSDHRTQEGSGDSVAHRNKKVEPSEAFTRSKDNGDAEPEASGPEYRGGRLFD